MDSRACLPIRPACPHEPEHLTLVIDFCKKWWTRIATKEMAFIGIVTLAASLVASWLKQFPGFSLFGAFIAASTPDLNQSGAASRPSSLIVAVNCS